MDIKIVEKQLKTYLVGITNTHTDTHGHTQTHRVRVLKAEF